MSAYFLYTSSVNYNPALYHQNSFPSSCTPHSPQARSISPEYSHLLLVRLLQHKPDRNNHNISTSFVYASFCNPYATSISQSFFKISQKVLNARALRVHIISSRRGTLPGGTVFITSKLIVFVKICLLSRPLRMLFRFRCDSCFLNLSRVYCWMSFISETKVHNEKFDDDHKLITIVFKSEK